MTADAPLLEVAGLEVAYGRLQVLFGVDLTVERGGAVALLGTNGAGKSTLLRAAAGLVPVTAGTIRLEGEDVTGMSPADRVVRGMTLMEGGRALCPSLTVRENLRLGGYPFRRDTARLERRIGDVLDLFPALAPLLQRPAGGLSGGEQQQAALARALLPEPRLLLVDELSLGLAPVVMAMLVSVVEGLIAGGTTVVLVEQSLNIALAVTTDAFFLEKGEVRFHGPTADLLDRGDLVRSVFFGAEAATA